MKKTALSAIFLAILVSCKRESIEPTLPETNDQLLTKVIKTTTLGDGHSYDEVANYDYNEVGKVITEGSKSYMRDDKQRIVRILDQTSPINRRDIQVYYSDSDPTKVAYTFCRVSGGDPATDSIVYIHDGYGRLSKTMSYIHSFGGTYVTDTIFYYQHTVPDTTFLYQYTLFKYDDKGNVKQLDIYNLNIYGNPVHCKGYRFENYDNMVNPQYADDEVRMMEYSFDGIVNASKNNFTSVGIYSKNYEYRKDGRPRSCAVNQNGTPAFKLTFQYR